MGNRGSTVAGASGSEHVFTSSTPVQFSQQFVESLQNSSETDSTRAKSIELHIQNRVAEELKRIQERETQTLADLEKKLSSSDSKDGSSGSTTFSSALDAITPSSLSSKEPDPTREGVLKEIETLKARLGERKKQAVLDKEVEKAKEDVVACLRLNDRRPLDCWKEVETFKTQVRRLEGGWVERVIS